MGGWITLKLKQPFPMVFGIFKYASISYKVGYLPKHENDRKMCLLNTFKLKTADMLGILFHHDSES